MNALAMVLVALGILVSYAVRSPTLRGETKVHVTDRLQENAQEGAKISENNDNANANNDVERY